jgi:hypothetical protein
MKMVLRRKWVWGLFFSIYTLGLAILWVDGASPETKPSLAILPFFIERVEDPARGAVCPVCKRVYQQGDILPGSQNILTRILQEKMEATGTFGVIPIEKVEEALSQRDQKLFADKLIPSSIQLGKDLNTDFIIVGFLFRFEERIGSAIGVEKPASVAFDIHLYRLRDGKMVWEGRFDETQKPLSENLLEIGTFIKGKGTWVTAEELSKIGMEKMIKKFPGPKELEEIP